MTVRETKDHDVISFLSRPIIVDQGEWSSSQISGTQISTLNFPEALVLNPMYQEKMRGFVGLRATLVVRVQVNTQPFQQGRLLLQYIPYAKYLGVDRVNMINSSLQGRSGCPRTDLDVSVGTEITMRIPYVSPYLYYNLITQDGSFGTVYLVVYSQLQDEINGTGSVEYTMWAHLEDVEIEFPTGAPIGIPSSDRLQPHVWNELVEMKQSGVISNTLGVLSSGLSTLTELPIIGKYLETPSWISSTASNIAKLFGFSKPTAQNVPCDAKLRGQVRMANYNGVDMSHKMALSADNEIETQDGLAGTSVDEMAISAFASIPNYYTRFQWSTSDNTGAILWNDDVTPMRLLPTSTTDVFNTTHMGWLANIFTYWRGSIVYTFKFVKTHFHTGRLQIMFIPFAILDSTPVDPNKCYRTIVDLRESTEVSFTVPYVSTRPWSFTTRTSADWTDGLSRSAACMTGLVRVEVLNKLVAGHNVHQTVDCIVEVNGGPDMTFAGPTCPALIPYYNKPASLRLTPHVMGANEAVQRNDAQLGQSPDTITLQPLKSNWSPQALCIGEAILSIRQLIKRFGPIADLVLTPEFPDVLITPFAFDAPPTSVSDIGPFLFKTMLEYFVYVFAFHRGSVRIKTHTLKHDAYSDDGDNFSTKYAGYQSVSLYTSANDQMNHLINFNYVPVTADQDSSAAMTTNINVLDALAGQSMQVIDPTLEGLIEVEVPYYNASHITPTSIIDVGQMPLTMEDIYNGKSQPSALVVQLDNSFIPPSKTLKTRVYRAAGDDFSFLYTLGVPQLLRLPNPTRDVSTLGSSTIYQPD